MRAMKRTLISLRADRVRRFKDRHDIGSLPIVPAISTGRIMTLSTIAWASEDSFTIELLGDVARSDSAKHRTRIRPNRDSSRGRSVNQPIRDSEGNRRD